VDMNELEPWRNWNERNLKNQSYLRVVINIFLKNWLVNESNHRFQLVGWNYCCDNDVSTLIVKGCCICLIAWGESEKQIKGFIVFLY
jgi:hypothetical protein